MGVGQVVVSLLVSVLMLGHKAGTVNGIINSVNRRKDIEEVLEQLERSKSPSELSDAVVKHARRRTLRDGGEDIVQVASACVRGAHAAVGCGLVDACVDLGHRFAIGPAWATMTGSSCTKEEYRSQHKPDGRTAAATCGRALTVDRCRDAEPSLAPHKHSYASRRSEPCTRQSGPFGLGILLPEFLHSAQLRSFCSVAMA